MPTRFLPLVLLCSALLLPMRVVFAASPTIKVAVPSYQYPGNDPYASAGGIANNGTTVGFTVSGNFLRFADGEFSPLFTYPGAYFTLAQGVNNSNLVCGEYQILSPYGWHGFFYNGTAFTQYDVPGAADTHVLGINDAGDFCGYYTDVVGGKNIPFVNIGGTLETFDIPGAEGVLAAGINNLGQVVGYYNGETHQSQTRGFLRDADGTLTYPLHFPRSRFTYINGINDQGIMVGTYQNFDYSSAGFVLKLPPGGGDISYNYSDISDFTHFTGINNSLFISGDYSNSYFVSSFIVKLAR